jgi:hypothetical protein
MSEDGVNDLARQSLATALANAGVATDDERLTHLTEFTAALLTDARRLTPAAGAPVEPAIVLRLTGAEQNDG